MRRAFTTGFVVTFAILFLLAISPMYTQAAGDYVAENVSITVNGVPCMVDFKTDGTALIWKVSEPEQEMEWVLPETITYEGGDFVLTELSWSSFISSSSQVKNITSLQLPNTLISLNSSSFNLFPNLTELTIPGSVKKFSASFQNMAKLQRLVFAEGVEELATGSMVNNCSSLTEIVLSDSLKRITGTATFSGATELHTIELPEGVEITQGSTFRGCSSLERITLPASVSKITSSMFASCTSLESVVAEGEISEIGSSAFDGCNMLLTVEGLENVTQVDSYAFQGCSILSGNPSLAKLTQVGSYAFDGCTQFAADISEAQLTSVGMYAFRNCTNLTGSLDLSQATSVGKYAFYRCSMLSGTFDLSGLSSIPTYAFAECGANGSGVDAILFGNTLNTIESSAFASARLEGMELFIPSSVERIEENAFFATHIAGVTIDNSSDEIVVDDNVFPAGIVPVYTILAVNGDETIDGITSIHDAVAAGGCVTLQQDVVLSQPLVIETDVILTPAR